jgi:hypothetical protein
VRTTEGQEGVEGTECEEAWMITTESVILLHMPPLLGIFLFFLIKKAYFSAGSLRISTWGFLHTPRNGALKIVILPQFERVTKAEIYSIKLGKGIDNGQDSCAVSAQAKSPSKREEVESKRPPGQRLTRR